MTLVEALRWYLANDPAFRAKPMGAPGSEVRIMQEQHQAAEDAIKAYLDSPARFPYGRPREMNPCGDCVGGYCTMNCSPGGRR